MCETLKLYNSVCQPPQEALKTIQAGRLKGKTDINPMWRIKKLTEIYGPCGIGWNIQNVRYQYIPSEGTGEMICLCELELVVFTDGAWSAPIYGIGGNMLVAKEKNGLYADDDAPKKAYSDAIGTACKALGFAGNIYWQNDPTKYSPKPTNNEPAPQPKPQSRSQYLEAWCNEREMTLEDFGEWFRQAKEKGLTPAGKMTEMTPADFNKTLAVVEGLRNGAA